MKRLILVLVLLISGCATVVPTPEVESLAPVAEKRSFELNATFNTDVFQLQPGRYVATWANELGTIYRGPSPAVLWNPAVKKWWSYEGGVWIPSAKSQVKLPRVVTIGGTYAEFEDRQSALAGSQQRAASNDLASLTTSIGMSQPNFGVAGAAGAATGGAIVSAIIAADAEKVRGKPIFMTRSRPPGIFEPVTFTPAEAASFERAAVWTKETQSN